MHAYGLSEKNIDVILRIEALIGRIAVQAAEFLWVYNSVYFISPSWHVHTVTMPSLSIIHKNRLLQSPQYPECPDPELSHPYGKRLRAEKEGLCNGEPFIITSKSTRRRLRFAEDWEHFLYLDVNVRVPHAILPPIICGVVHRVGVGSQ